MYVVELLLVGISTCGGLNYVQLIEAVSYSSTYVSLVFGADSINGNINVLYVEEEEQQRNNNNKLSHQNENKNININNSTQIKKSINNVIAFSMVLISPTFYARLFHMTL